MTISEFKKNQITQLSLDFNANINAILASADILVDLSCQSPEYIEYTPDINFRDHHALFDENLKEFDIVCDGQRKETYNIWMASNKMLGVRTYPTEGDVRDRVELILSSLHDSDALKFGGEKTLSYNILLPSGENPTKETIFTQVWQHDCLGAVPFTIWFKPGTTDYELYARVTGCYAKFGAGTIRRGVKTHCEYKFSPAIEDGYIKVQIGDQYHEFQGMWGEAESGPFEIRLGLYRHNQMVDTVLCFDDIKLIGHP